MSTAEYRRSRIQTISPHLRLASSGGEIILPTDTPMATPLRAPPIRERIFEDLLRGLSMTGISIHAYVDAPWPPSKPQRLSWASQDVRRLLWPKLRNWLRGPKIF